MRREKLRQGWYALALPLIPLAVLFLDRNVGWYADLPRVVHWLAGLGVALLILLVLRVTNPWERAAASRDESTS
ncbi:hypothetical protein OO014_17655 [Intrasporangium calvum]|uniref:Uncharacterized protein n=1 Tax=Intrasporangium calvum TaxID=53358 RepID=A0ABT5GLZ5_9MICO|nr:hypothetical protein [Intrasporangium calvum]MDC5699078.1 hypothetical protein [Intrasporangium calvum]